MKLLVNLAVHLSAMSLTFATGILWSIWLDNPWGALAAFSCIPYGIVGGTFLAMFEDWLG